MSYECRIKMERQNLACKGFGLFFLFCKNANDSEMERSGIELNDCMALIAYEVGVRAMSSFQHIK